MENKETVVKPMRVGVVACCGLKADKPCAAQDLYQSALFRKSRAYVERTCDGWIILSAKYGPMFPIAKIEPYDLKLGDLNALERDLWARTCRADIKAVFPADTCFVVLAGAAYRKVFQEDDETHLPHEVPMRGMGIGKQLAWLTAQNARLGEVKDNE